MDGIIAALAASLVVKLTDFFKLLLGKNYGSALRTIMAWGIGFIVAVLFKFADITAAVTVYGHRLGGLDFGSLVLVGLLIGSGGSVIYDFKRAVDNTDSASTTPKTIE